MTSIPVSKSEVELCSMMRYLAVNELGMEYRNSWRTRFVDTTRAF